MPVLGRRLFVFGLVHGDARRCTTAIQAKEGRTLSNTLYVTYGLQLGGLAGDAFLLGFQKRSLVFQKGDLGSKFRLCFVTVTKLWARAPLQP